MEEPIRHARAEITLRSTTQDLSHVPPKFDAVGLWGQTPQSGLTPQSLLDV